MAEIKRLTGARPLMHEADVPLLESGGHNDFHFGGQGAMFEPLTVDQRLQDGETVRLGTTELTLHHHPGHTKGASSFSFITHDDGRDYQVLIVNMGSINNGVALLDSPGYRTISDDYARTFERQRRSLRRCGSPHTRDSSACMRSTGWETLTTRTGSSIPKDIGRRFSSMRSDISISCTTSGCTKRRDEAWRSPRRSPGLRRHETAQRVQEASP